MTFNQGCKGLVPKSGLNCEFLYYYLHSIREELDAMGTGATFRELSAARLKEVPIPLPPLPTQQRIVAILDEAFAAIATAKANTKKNICQAKELFQSCLHLLFAARKPGWTNRKIYDVATTSLGKMLDKNKNLGELQPYLRNVNVRWFDVDTSDMYQMRFLAGEAEKYTARRGDVLICEGGYPGRCAIWEGEAPVYFQKALHRVRFHNTAFNKWLVYYLYYLDSSEALKQYFTGTGIQHFTAKSLSRLILPMPPDNLIGKYTSLCERYRLETEHLVAIYEQELAALEALKKSLLHQAFTGQLTERFLEEVPA
jgi:type I restriction enzyme S subunit